MDVVHVSKCMSLTIPVLRIAGKLIYGWMDKLLTDLEPWKLYLALIHVNFIPISYSILQFNSYYVELVCTVCTVLRTNSYMIPNCT